MKENYLEMKTCPATCYAEPLWFESSHCNFLLQFTMAIGMPLKQHAKQLLFRLLSESDKLPRVSVRAMELVVNFKFTAFEKTSLGNYRVNFVNSKFYICTMNVIAFCTAFTVIFMVVAAFTKYVLLFFNSR